MVGLALICGCRTDMTENNRPAPLPDINTVLAAHGRELMAKPGIVGVCIGVLKNGKTPCIKVMLEKNDAAVKRSIPRTLEGHPVVTEVTGEIRPISQSQ